jgi:hypothetical protein
VLEDTVEDAAGTCHYNVTWPTIHGCPVAEQARIASPAALAASNIAPFVGECGVDRGALLFYPGLGIILWAMFIVPIVYLVRKFVSGQNGYGALPMVVERPDVSQMAGQFSQAPTFVGQDQSNPSMADERSSIAMGGKSYS